MKKLLYLLVVIFASFTYAFSQSSYTVTSPTDDGNLTAVGTLSWAVTQANSSTASVITFSVSSVTLTTALPDITRSCTFIGASPLNVNTEQGGTTIVRSRAAGTAEFRLFQITSGQKTEFVNITLTNGNLNGNGGAIRARPANLILTNCLLTGNYGSTGGAIAAIDGKLDMISTRVTSNTADQEAGLYLQSVTATITNCQLTNNSSNQGGGLRFNSGSQAVVTNTLISNNTATATDAAIRLEDDSDPSSVSLVNCTITNNKVLTSIMGAQSAIWVYPAQNLSVYNTIIAGNTFNGVPADISGTLNSSSSNNLIGVGGGLTNGVNGNLIGTDKNPLFVNSAAGNYQLLACSPAINAGNPSSTTATIGATDLAGQSRIFGARIDMGAYEAQTAPVSTTLAIASPNGTTLTCARQAVSLSAVVTGGSNYTYTYTGPSTNTTTTNSSVLVSRIGTYTIATASTEGCVNSATISVSSNTLTPGVSLSATNSGVLTCSNPILTLSASSTTGTASFSFAGPAIANTAPTAISLNGQGTYSVTATNTVNGCISSTTASITSSTETPGVSLTTTNGGVLTCGTQTLTLTANSSTSGVNYSFASPNSFTQTGNSIAVNSAGTYSVTAINPITGCYSVASLTVSSSLIPPGSIAVARAGAIGCGPNSVTLTASTSGATAYSLSPGGQANNTGQFIVTIIGTYTVTASNGAGASCQSPTTITISQGTNAVAGAITASGPASCVSPAWLTASGTGSSFVFTGPGGYVFSNAYRTAGSYMTFAEGVKLGGTYTLTVYSSEGCPPASSRVVVAGPTSCP